MKLQLVALCLAVSAVSLISHVTQLALYQQQRQYLQSQQQPHFVHPPPSLDEIKSRGVDQPSCETGHSTKPDFGLVTKATCYMDELFHVPQTLRYSLLHNFSYYDPMITTPLGAYVLPAVVVHAMRSLTAATATQPPVPQATVHAASPGAREEMQMALLIAQGCSGSAAEPNGVVASLLQLSCGVFTAVVQSAKEVLPEYMTDMLDAVTPRSFVEYVHVMRRTSSVGHAVFWVWACVSVATFQSRSSHVVQQGHISCTVSRCLLCFLFPPLLFSSLLVYTDTTSAALTAAVLVFFPTGFSAPSFGTFVKVFVVSVIGLCAVLVRQTNIVWLFFAASRFLLERLAASIICSPRSQPSSVSSVVDAARTALFVLSPAIAVACLFVMFVVANGGIVLGDKSSHQPALHLAQIVYLLGSFCLFFPAVSLRSFARHFSLGNWKCMVWCSAWILASAFLLENYAIFHPYLVADNRHYTNVLYRKVLVSVVKRIVLFTPLSLVGTFFVYDVIVGQAVTGSDVARTSPGHVAADRAVCDRMAEVYRVVRHGELLLFLFCSLAICVPQQLIEFRYFAPIAMTCLLLRKTRRDCSSNQSAIAEWIDVFFAIAIHLVTCYVFVEKTFTAPDSSVGRFMW